ncbi:response regulator receiver sensor signal transduction histidine kinase [Cyanobacterium stanieri PCC 7202]|uniref:histidine kinase n=1 Tax=Cyanobacterium stanieri (strain ATCC 29140 / PCC 7202) TaxID=292563 RepID=K9YIY6_CYASC|nr:response regulator receiver sensor signal transduction histidine kinase [Cyanobacterium stanieri PCC 7202]
MKNYTILVVDDEPDNFDVIETFLSEENYNLHYAFNGYDGIACLEDVQPDLILLDVMMPELDGIEVCRQIKDRPKWKSIPIIMVTALNSKEDLSHCLKSGADDFIGKPVNSVELKARVKSMLRIKAQYDQISGFSVLQRNTINILAENIRQLTGNIAISLSHELNTPLNGIMGILGILKADFDNLDREEISELLDFAQLSANNLVNVSKRFLVFLELEISNYNPDRQISIKGECPFSTSMVTSLTQTLAEKSDRSEDLVFDIEEAQVEIQEKYLCIIVKELVSNALKFSQKNTKVTISSQIKNNQLQISIDNYGRGMTPEQIGQIGTFIQFNRNKYQQEGIGIGLKLVQIITKACGGTMQVSSIAGERIRVTVSLPAVAH